MNDKGEELNRIIDIVIKCCDMEGRVTKDLLLGGSNRENVVMTRCVLVSEVIRAGYTITTCAEMLGCSPQTARMLLARGYDLERVSRAYRLAKAEAERLVDEGADCK